MTRAEKIISTRFTTIECYGEIHRVNAGNIRLFVYTILIILLIYSSLDQ